MKTEPLKPLMLYSVEELLEKFGEGNHRPGSGSAAALQGMISAQLIRTVISLTSEEKRRPQYDKWLSDFQSMKLEIETSIYPTLARLFQEDSDQFDKTIELRKKRNAETNPERKAILANQALEALVPSTEMPVDIALCCAKLGDMAAFVFEHGFNAVRGDSAVALNGAVSGLFGCLSIIELNLLSFGWNEWTREIRLETKELKTTYERLLAKSGVLLHTLEEENKRKRSIQFDNTLAELQSGRWEDLHLSEVGIEDMAKKVQNALWDYREMFWKEDTPGAYLDVLQPDVVIEKILGYQFAYRPLGRHTTTEGEFEIAGQIDKKQKVVLISRSLPPAVQNFTAAHELGHALMHKGLVLHRDRPLDGSHTNMDIKERQADKFATFFLMPAQYVREIFLELFLMEKFAINDNTVFSIEGGRVSSFRKKVRDINGLARYLAAAEHFQGKSFRSMANIFNVSIGAMAIRLKELDLLEY
jgi:formiminotetrahydrofolate cyclodeaminase